ncbi:MAG: cysteine--tRNA ligase [Propionibacteriaceae bacterium]
MQIRLHDSRTHKLVELVPIVEGKVGIYTCGPTVYSPQHLGNMRSQLYPDLLRRLLEHEGLEVTYVTNITDVGHLTSDGDEGDDKMELSAQREGKTAADIAEYWTQQWAQDRRKLNCLEPTYTPRATAYIEQQIEMAKVLEAQGYTYLTEDGLYFDIATFPRYADFAGLDLNGMAATDRIDNVAYKRNPADFALWKLTAAGVQRLQEWQSPWGMGFPGWHLECSVMATDLLGKQFDIHTGGIDHLRVHHTNEVAQSECALGVQPWVNIWMHNEFLNFSGLKMSKSKGHVIVVDSLVEEGIDPLAFRWFFFQGHYRQQQAFSLEQVRSAGTAMQRFIDRSVAVRDAVSGELETLSGRAKELAEAFWGALADDLNAPKALAIIAEAMKDQSLSDSQRWSLYADMDQVLALDLAQRQSGAETEAFPAELTLLIERRTAARAAKDWASADAIRDDLKALGWEVIDTATGPQPRRLS